VRAWIEARAEETFITSGLVGGWGVGVVLVMLLLLRVLLGRSRRGIARVVSRAMEVRFVPRVEA